MGGVTNTQGMSLYLVAMGTDLADAAKVATAKAAGKKVECFMEIGDLTLGTASVTEYNCMTSDNSFKSIGRVSYGNITPQLIYDVTDVAGQKDLKDMWKTKTRRMIIIELPNQITPTTGNPSYFIFEGAISAPTLGLPADGAVLYSPTIEICSKVEEIEAT